MMQKVSKIEKFYAEQCSQILGSIRLMERVDQPDYNSSDLSILFLGPAGSSKSLLVKSICRAMNNKIQISEGNHSKETVQTDGLILSKTELTKPRTYKVGSKEYRERRAINLYEFNERIFMNSLSCFARLFDLIQSASEAMCSCKVNSGFGSQKRSANIPIQAVILVVDVGKTISEEELECTRQILNDLKEREIQPILALCSRHSENQLSEEEKMEKIEQEIKSAHQLFAISRENVYAIQLNEDGRETQECSYYILRLLEASLKEATEFASRTMNQSKSKNKSSAKIKENGWSSIFFPCWG